MKALVTGGARGIGAATAKELQQRGWTAVTADLDGGRASGFVCRGGRHIPLLEARVALGPADAPLERLALDLQLADGERVRIVARASHRLPVVRTRGPVPVRLEFAACRLDGGQEDEVCPAGWCEVAGF
jgi:NAD(P)-dependent dehydrogenase (short-subunit alcohol dehydrogenase family)